MLPFKKLSKKIVKDKIWVTIGIKKSTKTKLKLYRAWVKKPTEGRTLMHKKYKIILKRFVQLQNRCIFMTYLVIQKHH